MGEQKHRGNATPQTGSTIRFGPYELDVRTAELRRNRLRIRLQEQPFLILVALLERPGEVVLREEIRRRLWPDNTVVEFDHGINAAVKRLRDALCESGEKPRYIETLARKGYRFIGEVQDAVEPAVPETLVEPAVPETLVEPVRTPGPRRSRWMVAGFLVVVGVSLAAAFAGRRHRPRGTAESSVSPARPFTALPGRAMSPAFSPDGSRIAFAWNGDPRDHTRGYDLYVKALGSETLLRLTAHLSTWISPAWSPDGTQIAFHRMTGGDAGIYVVPALGGPERKLRSTHLRASEFAAISWSPDGKWIAFADQAPSEERTKISLLSVDTSDAEQLSVDAGCIREGLPAFSHKGADLAFWCLRWDLDSVLYRMPLRGTSPKALTSIQAFATGLTWSADDGRLLFSHHPVASRTPGELGEFSFASGAPRRLEVPGNAQQPTVSINGDKLAYSSLVRRLGLWRKDLTRPGSRASELMPSSRTQFDAQYSPDGRSIAFASLRSGTQGVWISSADGTGLVQISNPSYVSGSPQWSPDGSRIAFDVHTGEHWEIYQADIAEQRLTKLITTVSNVIRPHWSRDGQWLYFTSHEPGKMGTYRCLASGGVAVLLAQGADDRGARESADGHFVYLASAEKQATLKRIALTPQPGTESKVDSLPELHASGLWTLAPSGIYFVPANAPRSLRYFDFATKQVRAIFEVDSDFGYGLSISPDGRSMLYSLVGDDSSDIMLVERFH